MLLVAAIFKGAQSAINALKSDIHVQYMVNGAKLQMQGIISKSDTLAALAGKISSILKCVEGSFTAEAMAYLEQYLTAEKGSRFLEAVRKLEKELGDKMPQLDTAKAKRIVESLDDGKSVDDVVAELKNLCESGVSIAHVSVEKFSKYIFKDGATHGKNVVFENMGYSKADSEYLANLYIEQANIKFTRGEYTLGKLDQYGQRINIEIELNGIGEFTGKTSFLKSGWMINSDGTISLNTPFTGFTK